MEAQRSQTLDQGTSQINITLQDAGSPRLCSVSTTTFSRRLVSMSQQRIPRMGSYGHGHWADRDPELRVKLTHDSTAWYADSIGEQKKISR